MDINDVISELESTLNKKLKLADLSKILGVSKRTITRWKTGKSNPSIKSLNKIKCITKSKSQDSIILDALCSGSVDAASNEISYLTQSGSNLNCMMAVYSVAIKVANQLAKEIDCKVISIDTIYGLKNCDVRIRVIVSAVTEFYVLIKKNELHTSNSVCLTLMSNTPGRVIYHCDATDKNILSMIQKARKYSIRKLL